MKILNKIAILALAAAAMASCTENYVDPVYYPNPDVDFTYNVDGDQYTLDFYVVSTVQFNNTSVKQGNFTWDFGDGETSTEVSPLHKYKTAGNYQVTLKLEGVGTKTYPLMIQDITPVLTVKEQSTEIIEFNNTTMTFELELPNPENLPVKYVWSFPEGTTYADGTPVTEFVGAAHEDGTVDYPAPVLFKNIGSQKVTIATTFDTRDGGENRRLADAFLNVQVGTTEPCATLYYAQRGGNIKALKLVDNVPAGTKVMPYDMGVAAGSTVYNLLWNQTESKAGDDEEGAEGEESTETAAPAMIDWIYILDAGKQYYYVNDENGVLGDGNITAMKSDGTGVNVVLSNVGGAAFNDPYRGFIKDGIIYYSDRNAGFSQISCTTRGAVQEQELNGSTWRRTTYIMTNENTPFKDQGISWGAATNGLYKDANGYWWIGKFFNGNGIFRFRDSDVYASETEAKKHPLPSEVLLSGSFTSTFAVDEARGVFYAWRSKPEAGIYEFPIVGYKETVAIDKPTARVLADCTPDNTTADEGLFVTQLAVDPETGKVYFCLRPEATDGSGLKAGIVCYDPATKKCKNYGETTDLGTGIVINPTKTKLF